MTAPSLHDPNVRLVTRTGDRTAQRGPTVHHRHLTGWRRAELVAGGPVERRPRRRRPQGGPVRGCTPTACWHSRPHWAWTGQ